MYDTYTDYVSRDVWHLYWLCVTWCMTPILTMCHRCGGSESVS